MMNENSEVSNMDIYKYINSKDVRKHLEKINYQFNTLEAAYLIFFS